jgi:Ca2+-transporting ATPase
MGVLAGLIFTFLGASILNIVSGVPFLPLQTLWLNFTTQVFQSIGLGYGAPSPGLMERRPRKPDEPILTRATARWFAIAGLVMAASTLAVVAGAEHDRGADLARTMGLTTFAISNLVFSFTARDELRSVLSLGTFNDRRFVVASLLSAVAIILATESQFLHRILDTVELSGNQWLICIGAGMTVVVVSEVRKALLRRRKAAGNAPAADAAPEPAAA